MLNEPRTYSHSPIRIGLIIFVLGALGIFLLTTMDWTDKFFLIPFVGFFGIIFITVLYSMMQKATISDDEISTQTFLGTKSLRWSEISRVSGQGYGIKLHNFDGDVTIAPNQQLPGYEELVDWIGVKRPDLFNPLEYGEMKRGWFTLASLAALVIFFVAVLLGSGILFFNNPQAPVSVWIPFFFIVIIAAIFFGMAFSSPQSVTIDGRSLYIKYLFSEKTLLANEITSVDLRFTQTRNGKNYFVLLTLTNKKTIRIAGLSIGLPIVYLVLKNWHRKNSIEVLR